MIFQDSQSSLNPTKSIGEQVAEPFRLHRGASKKEGSSARYEVLELVGLPRPKERLADYPHQLSGGLRQRVMIAIALTCEPRVLLADEPTTALDVTIQAQILSVLDELKERLGMATLLVTHDMGVVAGRTERINVMYAGRLVETAPTDELFRSMRHPYTQALLGSIPKLDSDPTKALVTIPGIPPDLTDPPFGCRFAPRCPYATQQCREQEPPLTGEDPRHLFACWHPVDGPITQATGDPRRRRRLGRRLDQRLAHGRRRQRQRRAPAVGRGRGPRVPGHVRRVAATQGRVGQGRLRGHAAPGPGRDVRSGRRVGLWQDDARQADRRHREAQRRAGSRSTAGRSSSCAAATCAAAAATCR